MPCVVTVRWGQVFSWGNGEYGKLGHGAVANELQPRLVEALALV